MAEKKKTTSSSKGSKATSGGKAPAKGGARASGRRRQGSRAKRIVGRIALGLLVLGLVLTLIGTIAAVIFYQRTELPDPNKDFTTNTTFVYYRDGKTKIGSFAIQNRQTIPYDQMSPFAKDAVIAAENRTFWTDRGISPSGIARSVISIARGREVQGGSTITQQYIKIYYLTSDRTMSRKFRELALAVKMGRQKPKEEILRDYLNTIYFGRGAYGLQAASRSYFNTDANKLTLEQAAVLASVLNNPSLFDPNEGKGNAARLLDRYRYVLDGMLSMGTITQAQHTKAYAKLPVFPEIPRNAGYGGTKGYILAQVRNELLDNGFTDAQIAGGGLNITTTFDAKLQAQAVKVAQEYTAKVAKDAQPAQDPSKLHIALASVQVGTGEVLAMYGGPDYVKNTRNWALTDRPAASTFKAYAAVAGIRSGFSLRSRFNGDTFTPPGDSSTVRNEFGHQYGEVSLTKATQDSINTAFVDMTVQMEDGPAKIVKAANDAGVPSGAGWDLNNRISLGTAEVSPLDNATGFATLANNGKRAQTHVVKQVKDAKGKVIHNPKVQTNQAIESDIAKDVTHALTEVVNQGTGNRVRDLGFPIAGKTGTSGVGDAITSAWFVAYTKQISTAVMFVAGDGGNGDLDPYKKPGNQTFYGGTYPAMVWADFMRVALEGQEKIPFDDPVYVNSDKKESATPSETPSASASETPSASPTPSQTPSETPSQTPSETATTAPTEATSQAPTTEQPSTQPTQTQQPTEQPTTEQPTQQPSTEPPATASAAPSTKATG